MSPAPRDAATVVASRAVKAAGMILAFACGMAALACGSPAAPSKTSASAAAPDAAPATTTDAEPTDAGAPSDGRPFAGSTADATDLISRAVDTRHAEVARCTHAFRIRKKMPHDKITVSFGIDQEGRLLGVTAKGREDAELKRCVLDAMTGAPFPRSHAGVITVTKVYEELVLQ